MISDATFIMQLSMVVHCWLPACIQPIVAAQKGGPPAIEANVVGWEIPNKDRCFRKGESSKNGWIYMCSFQFHMFMGPKSFFNSHGTFFGTLHFFGDDAEV